MPLRSILRSHLAPRRHTALLVALVCALAVRPLIGYHGAGPIAFSVAMLVLLLIALYNIQAHELVGEREALLFEDRRRRIFGWMLALLAIGERAGALLAPSPGLYRLACVTWLLFLAFVTWNQLRGVLRQQEVTGETISASIAVYLLLGVTWAFLYLLIFQLRPESFNLGASLTATSDLTLYQNELIATFIYFSFTTLTTIGFGDITPLSLQARYAAVAEGIIGQFYLAILVARLVGMHMSRSTDRDAGKGS